MFNLCFSFLLFLHLFSSLFIPRLFTASSLRSRPIYILLYGRFTVITADLHRALLSAYLASATLFSRPTTVYIDIALLGSSRLLCSDARTAAFCINPRLVHSPGGVYLVYVLYSTGNVLSPTACSIGLPSASDTVQLARIVIHSRPSAWYKALPT